MKKQQISNFWSKVDKSGDCWLWIASTDKDGYGFFRVGLSNKLAHRVSWTIHRGKIPKGMLVCHHCDNPSCVNPDHLFLGTHKDNAQDMVSKGRQLDQAGELNHNSSLTKDQVIEIRKKLRKRVHPADLANQYSVNRTTIINIHQNKTWIGVGGDVSRVRSKSRKSKLTEPEVSEIKRKLRSGIQGKVLAGEYGVTTASISQIKSGKRWGHVA